MFRALPHPPNPNAARAVPAVTGVREPMPWWEVMLPCEAPGGGRWVQKSKWVQARDEQAACDIAGRLLPPGYELDDSPSATRIENPHTIVAHRTRLAEAVVALTSMRETAAAPGCEHWADWVPICERDVEHAERWLAECIATGGFCGMETVA